MAKKVQGYIKLQVPAGSANPSPPIGPALGQQGVNIMEFCKQFNAQTQKLEKGLPIPVIITVYSDRSFTFIMKTPPASVLIRKAIGIEKGSGTPNTAKVGKITRKQLEEVATTQAARPDGRRPGSRGPHHCGQRAQHGRRRGGRLAMALTKRVKTWKDKLTPGKQYPVEEALKLVKEFATAKFAESVDAAVNLGIDASKSDQQVRGSTVMPHGTGKTVRVAVFTSGKNQELAKAAGADIVGTRGPGGAGEGRRDQFRSRDRQPRCHARRRPARPDPGSARPDAEPQGRHRDPGRGHRGEERQVRPGQLPRGQGRASSIARSARRISR